jgi:hypothetical protein
MDLAASNIAAPVEAVPDRSRSRQIGLTAWSLLPSLWLVTFLSLLIRARLALGEWPHPRIGTPLATGYLAATFGGDSRPIHGDLLNLIWPIALISPLWILTNRQVWLSGNRSKLALFALSYGLMLWIAFTDPGGFGSWAAD